MDSESGKSENTETKKIHPLILWLAVVGVFLAILMLELRIGQVMQRVENIEKMVFYQISREYPEAVKPGPDSLYYLLDGMISDPDSTVPGSTGPDR